MNLETKRNSSRLCSRTVSVQGTPGFSILSRLTVPSTLGMEPGGPANDQVITPARYICEGVGGCSTSLGDQNMLYRKSLPSMELPGAREWVGREPGAPLPRAGKELPAPLALVSSLWAMLRARTSSACGHLSCRRHHAAHPLPNATFLDIVTPHCSPKPATEPRPTLPCFLPPL